MPSAHWKWVNSLSYFHMIEEASKMLRFCTDPLEPIYASTIDRQLYKAPYRRLQKVPSEKTLTTDDGYEVRLTNSFQTRTSKRVAAHLLQSWKVSNVATIIILKVCPWTFWHFSFKFKFSWLCMRFSTTTEPTRTQIAFNWTCWKPMAGPDGFGCLAR